MKLPQIIVAITIIILIALVFLLPKVTFTSFPLLNTPNSANIQGAASSLNPFPVKTSNQNPPALTARAATVIDSKTGLIIFEKEPILKHLPASTTKLMTALVTLQNCSPQQIVKVGFVEKEGSQMGLEPGDTVSVENLLYGLLVPSGNDAAFTLANACSASYAQFIKDMNAKAKELGMQNTNFENPAGFDSLQQYSTASDLTKLSRAAVTSPLISKIVSTKSIVVTDTTATRTYYLQNINKLLGAVEGVEGVKTGQTEGALENLVTKITREGHTIIIVVLGSVDRFGETEQLINWAFANYKWQEVN